MRPAEIFDNLRCKQIFHYSDCHSTSLPLPSPSSSPQSTFLFPHLESFASIILVSLVSSRHELCIKPFVLKFSKLSKKKQRSSSESKNGYDSFLLPFYLRVVALCASFNSSYRSHVTPSSFCHYHYHHHCRHQYHHHCCHQYHHHKQLAIDP